MKKQFFIMMVLGVTMVSCRAQETKPQDAGLAEKMERVEKLASDKYAAFEQIYKQYVAAAESGQHDLAKGMEPRVEQLYEAYNAAKDSLMAIHVYGTPFTDLEMNNLQGSPVKLSQWVGKGNYVMIDFWASWCGPCRQEMPNVVANYAKYHAKGFEIVGVSFDSKAEAWQRAVEQLGMAWPQMSDLKGWQSAGAKAYGIKSIPASVLLDGDGKIVGMNLRGEALGEKLKTIYGF